MGPLPLALLMGAVVVADSFDNKKIATHDVAIPSSLRRRQVAPSSFLAEPSGDNETKLDNGGYMKRPGSWNALFEGNRVDETDLPKNLYMFWEQGHVQDTAEPLNKMCFKKWEALNPSWNFHLVTSDASAKSPEVSLTVLAPHLAELFQRIPRSVQLRSDMLRLEILAEHGGVWADGSLLPLRGLDTFAKQLVTQSGFFVFTYPDTDDPFFHYNASNDPIQTMISSWFMVSKPKNPLVVAWRDTFKKKWMDPSHHFAYFEAHMTLKEMILKKDPRIIDVWRSMPRISSWWPQLCLKGCSDYWDTSSPHDQPPFLKRPYQQAHKAPPSEWFQQWRSLLPQTAQTSLPVPQHGTDGPVPLPVPSSATPVPVHFITGRVCFGALLLIAAVGLLSTVCMAGAACAASAAPKADKAIVVQC